MRQRQSQKDPRQLISLLSTRHTIRFGTWNARSIYQTGKASSIAEAEEATKEEFYNALQSLIARQRGKEVTILMGDLNAKIGGDNREYLAKEAEDAAAKGNMKDLY